MLRAGRLAAASWGMLGCKVDEGWHHGHAGSYVAQLLAQLLSVAVRVRVWWGGNKPAVEKFVLLQGSEGTSKAAPRAMNCPRNVRAKGIDTNLEVLQELLTIPAVKLLAQRRIVGQGHAPEVHVGAMQQLVALSASACQVELWLERRIGSHASVRRRGANGGAACCIMQTAERPVEATGRTRSASNSRGITE